MRGGLRRRIRRRRRKSLIRVKALVIDPFGAAPQKARKMKKCRGATKILLDNLKTGVIYRKPPIKCQKILMPAGQYIKIASKWK